MDELRRNFSPKVDHANIFFVLSKSGKFEYVSIFMTSGGKRKNITSKYSDDQYFALLKWMYDNFDIVPWDDSMPYCRGVISAWEKDSNK
jgi:hypothetical protein